MIYHRLNSFMNSEQIQHRVFVPLTGESTQWKSRERKCLGEIAARVEGKSTAEKKYENKKSFSSETREESSHSRLQRTNDDDSKQTTLKKWKACSVSLDLSLVAFGAFWTRPHIKSCCCVIVFESENIHTILSYCSSGIIQLFE